MLIYITNRVLKKKPSTQPVALTHNQIGIQPEKSTGGNAAIHAGISTGQYKTVRFYPRGEEQKLFDSIPPGELNKPWLIFLHGFHQDVSETIKKVRKLNRIHGVNVVLFSWPSRPKPVKAIQKKDLQSILKQYLLSTIGFAERPALIGLAVGEIRKQLNDYYSNYEPARLNAEASVEDFYAALMMVKHMLLPVLKPGQLSMVVHSMGNYLLRQTIEKKGDLPLTFQNIICHQADVKASDHASWLPVLYGYANQGLYITVNKYDVVLGASSVYRLSKGITDVERLGASTTIKPKAGHQGYINHFVKYIDLTDGRGIENKHEIFISKAEKRDKKARYDTDSIDHHAVALFNRLFTGKKDELPDKKGSSKSGFSCMPTRPGLYRLDKVVEDEDLCEFAQEWNCMLSSLKAFKDPYASNVLNDEDFDDF